MNNWRYPRAIPVALLVAVIGGACGPATNPPPVDTLAGRVQINGGGGALPAIQALIAEFTRRHPRVSFEGLVDIGSDPGLALVAGGTLELGYISRELKPAEVGTVQTLSVGFTGTGILVNAANPLVALDRQQVASIYRGQVSDWSDIGGTPGKIVVLFREPGALRSRSTVISFQAARLPTRRPRSSSPRAMKSFGRRHHALKRSAWPRSSPRPWPTSESASSRSTALLRPRKTSLAVRIRSVGRCT